MTQKFRISNFFQIGQKI